MSKKDFVSLADTIRRFNRQVGPNQQFREEQIAELADFCAGQNRNFKHDLWLDYLAGKCGVSGGKVKGN